MSLILFAGDSAITLEVVGSGGIAFGGAAIIVDIDEVVGSGGITFGGAAVVAFETGTKGHRRTTFVMTGSGGIAFGGAATITRTLAVVASGGIVFGGTATLVTQLPPPVITFTWVASGGLAFGGSAEREIERDYEAAGGLAFGGSAHLIFVAPLVFDPDETLTEQRAVIGLPRVYIHYPHHPGHVLRELVSVQDVDRGWMQSDPRQASFGVPFDDVDEALLQPGNRIVITSPYFDTWVGYLVPVRHELRPGVLQLTALDVLAILDQRNVPGFVQYIKPIGSSQVIRELVEMANDRFYTGIQPAANLGVGPSIENLTPGGQSVLQAIQEVCSRTGREVWLEHDVTTNHIESTLHYGIQGQDLSASLHLFEGVHFAEMTHSRDGSPVKQVEEVYGEFGMEMTERAPVTRTTLSRMSGSAEYVATLSASAEASLPPGLITERVTIDPMAVTASMRSGRAERNQEYALPSQETFDDIVAMPALTLQQLRGLRVGNTWTRDGHFGSSATERRVRIRGVQPTEYEGIVRVSSWAVLD